MFTSSTTFGVLAALVGAGAYPASDPANEAAAHALPEQAVAEIRRAQVELYCDHTAQAVAGIRQTRERLRLPHQPLHASAIAGLDRAAWLARQGRLGEAEEALQSAIASLQAEAPPRVG